MELHQQLKGRFIVFDGTEGCGKSTQSLLLRRRIAGDSAGEKVVLVRDPGTTPIGEKLRSIVLDPANRDIAMRCEMLLYMAARSQMMAQIILPALSADKVVLCDRFVSSTLAYQLGGDELTATEIRAVAEVAIRGRWPDLTILLDMPAEKSLARVMRAKDRIEQRPLAYHQQVRRNYQAQALADPQRFFVIDADRAPEAVHEEICAVVERVTGATL